MGHNDKPYPLISAAIRIGDSQRLSELFISFPEMVELKVPAFGSWLHYAAAVGTLEIVQLLVSMGFAVNAIEERRGQRPIAMAASTGNHSIVQYLLTEGSIVDTSNAICNPLFATIAGSVNTNATHSPPNGKAPQIVRLLLESGMASEVTYNTKSLKNMDAVAYAMMMGARDLARIIALWNAKGDEVTAQSALNNAEYIADQNTIPVPVGEQYAPS